MTDETPDELPRPGPEPERLTLDMTFEEAVAKMLRTPRLADGWPKREVKSRWQSEKAEEEAS